MTEMLSKGVLRSTTVMFLFVGLVGIWMGGCETQEQKVGRLIVELQDQDQNVRVSAAWELGMIGEGAKDAIPALIQALQDEKWGVRTYAAVALGQIGTPEALKAAEEYQSQQ